MKWNKIITFFLFFALFAACFTAFSFWRELQKPLPDVYYHVPPQKSFVYGAKTDEFGFEEHVKEKIKKERDRLQENGESFFEVDLKKMELILYEEGEKTRVFPIQSKGRVGGLGETPPGVYSTGDKLVNHFSSVSNVWMPYAVQFYGNFFIHGWPYYTSGEGLPPGSSGGCIRMKTSDARVVFKFAKRGMPILVFDEKASSSLPALLPHEEPEFDLNVEASGVMVADLDTGEILAGKKMESEVEAGPLTRAMTGLVASEVVDLSRGITARSWMFEKVGEGIVSSQRLYTGRELLSLMFAQESKEAALTLSYFLTPARFVEEMNSRADSIGMENTYFADVTGSSEKNITTPYESAKLMRQILYYRGYLFNFGGEFKEGEKEGSFLTFLKMKDSKGITRNIYISLFNSPDFNKDFEDILKWLEKDLNLKSI